MKFSYNVMLNPVIENVEPEISILLRKTGGNYIQICEQYKIFYSEHPVLPLILFCYDNRQSPKCLLTNQCRGLVLEKETWKTVCWGMDRFIETGVPKTIVSIQEKEDGSLIFMFCYNGMWMLSTRHTFCDQPSEKLYLDGFLSVIKSYNIDNFAEKCKECVRCKDGIYTPNTHKEYTFCFELCLINHRIVRKYEKSTLFLICVYDNTTHLRMDFESNHKIEGIQMIKECIHKFDKAGDNRQTLQHLLSPLISKAVNDDLFFEGFVITDNVGQRYKVKSQLYKTFHDLRYRGWIKATQKIMAQFILNNQDDLIMSFIEETRPTDCDEFKKQLLHYKENRLFEATTLESTIMDFCSDHPNEYCEIVPGFLDGKDSGIAKSPVFISNKDSNSSCNDYGENWTVFCYCGHYMTCKRMKYDVIYKRKCHCGKIFGTIIYPCNTLLWQCSHCNCTHECYQKNATYGNSHVKIGQPLGIPASELCKILRLQIHENIGKVMKLYKCKKSNIYQWIQKMMKLSEDEAHIAKFNLQQCNELLQHFAVKDFSFLIKD